MPATNSVPSKGRAKAAEKIRKDTAAFSAAMNKGKVPAAPAPAPVADNVTKLPVKAVKAAAPSAVTFKPGQVQEVPFRDLNIAPGYNFRVFDPAKPEHRALAESIRLYGVHTPVTVWLENGKPFVAAGHLRVGACDWLSRDGGGKKSIVPSVPVIYNPWLDDPRNRLADLALSNSSIATTPMEKAEVAARMTADKYTPAAIGAVLGNIGTKWVSELVKLHELRGTALADMVQLDRISSTTALNMLKEHGKDTAVSIANAVWAELIAKAKFGDTPYIKPGHVVAYLAKLAKQTPTPPAKTDGGKSQEPAREPVDALGKAQAEVATLEAELAQAEFRRKHAKGATVKRARVAAEAIVAKLATAKAKVTELTPAPTEPAGNGKRGASKRTGENAEKDKGGAPAPESALYESKGAFVIVAKSGLRVATAAGKAGDDESAKARAVWIAKAMNRMDAIEPFTG